MADRTALTAGIAVASIAAVVAATPALITAPKNDVQITASAAVAAKTVSTDVQLAAFTVAGFLSAFADGYYDGTYADAGVDAALPQAYADAVAAANEANEAPPTKDEVRAQLVADATVNAEAGAIYYTLDNLLPAAFDFDDHFFTSDSDLSDGLDLTNFYTNSLIDLGVSSDIADLFGSFVSNPIATALAVVGLPPEVFDFINSPITAITDALDSTGFLTDLVTDPITTVINTAAGDLGPLINSFINDPIGTTLHQAGPLGDFANEFLNDPVGTTAALLGPDALNFVQSPVQEIARIVAAVLTQLPSIPGVNSAAALKSSSVESLDVASTAKTTPKLFTLNVPTPKEFVTDVENAFTPKTKTTKATVETVSADSIDAGTDAPAAPKFDLPKLPTPKTAIADFSDNLGKTAKSISDSLTLKPKKDQADDSDKGAPAADKSADKPDKPKGLGGFGGVKHHGKKAAASAG